MDTRSSHPSAGSAVWMRRVEAIFHETLGQPAGSRSGFLRERCGGDTALLRDVEALLSADSQEDALLDAPALGQSFSMPRPEALEKEDAPRRIGPYQLIRLLGSGGVAHVWLARRVDGHFEQEVAIKLIKRGMDSDAILARFEQERQLLARLEHPNIARLIDGGATSDGLPYLVMEFVDGTPIDRHCQEQRLSVSARIGLFRDICAAVQYAHQALVIHRDIKPGNILVTRAGRAKLLDFGIAKLLADEPQNRALTKTRRGGALLTPEYASPEQHRGDPVTTASDVYSLGVVLAELLTGLKPSAGRGSADAPNFGGRNEPTRPSTRVLRHAADGKPEADWPEGSPARLARRLRGDLDTILLKALAPDPAQRYATVDQLSEDLKRHLERRPIAARPPTRLYWAKRFVERNRASVAAGAVALLAIVGGLIATTAAYLQADAARRGEVKQRELADARLSEAQAAQARTDAEAAKLRATNAFLQQLLSTDDPLMKLRPSSELREVLAEAGRSLDAGALADQPAVEAAIRLTVGRTYKDLKMADRGEPHLRKVLEIQRTLPGGQDLFYADAVHVLAVCLCEQRKFREGIPLHRTALALQRSLAPQDEQTLMAHLWGFSAALRDDGKLMEAESVLREALDIALRRNGARHADTAEARFRLGWTLLMQKRYDEAETELRTALGLQTELLGADHPACGETRLRLGFVLERREQIAEAEALIRDAFRILRSSLGDSHPNTLRAKSNLARFISSHGDETEAEQMQREVIAQSEAYFGPANSSVANSYLNLGMMQFRHDELKEAEASLREALKRHSAQLGADDATTQDDRFALADVFEKGRRFADAEAMLSEACSLSEKAEDSSARRKPVEQLIRLYETWCQADPQVDRCNRIPGWRERLATLP